MYEITKMIMPTNDGAVEFYAVVDMMGRVYCEGNLKQCKEWINLMTKTYDEVDKGED